jgi:hypothetical protein
MAVVAVGWWSRIAVQDSVVAVRSSGSSNTNLVVAAATLNSNSKQWADKRLCAEAAGLGLGRDGWRRAVESRQSQKDGQRRTRIEWGERAPGSAMSILLTMSMSVLLSMLMLMSVLMMTAVLREGSRPCCCY